MAKSLRKQKTDVLRGTPLNPNISDALRYQKKLDVLINRMAADVEAQLKKLFKTSTAKEYFAADDSISGQAKILTNALTEKWESIFTKWSKPIAESVAEGADKSSAVAMRSSIQAFTENITIKATSLSAEMKDILSATTTENVALIKSISTKYLNGVQQAVMRSITTGRGLADLIPYLENTKQITRRRARMIANDQTRKAFNAMNRGRMNKLGVAKFEWLHSGGSQHPRKDHIELSGKIFSIDDPPVIDKATGQRGFPGDLINCRCRYVPVLTLNEEE